MAEVVEDDGSCAGVLYGLDANGAIMRFLPSASIHEKQTTISLRVHRLTVLMIMWEERMVDWNGMGGELDLSHGGRRKRVF